MVKFQQMYQKSHMPVILASCRWLRPRRGHVRRCGFPMTEYLTYISHVRGDAVGDMEWWQKSSITD